MSSKKSKLEGAVRLPSSNEIFGHDNGDFEEEVLLSLLEEAFERKLPMNAKIIITDEFLDLRKIPDNCNDLSLYTRDVQKKMSVQKLNELYKRIHHQDYNLEFEKERSENERRFHEDNYRREAGLNDWLWQAIALSGKTG